MNVNISKQEPTTLKQGGGYEPTSPELDGEAAEALDVAAAAGRKPGATAGWIICLVAPTSENPEKPLLDVVGERTSLFSPMLNLVAPDLWIGPDADDPEVSEPDLFWDESLSTNFSWCK